MPILIGVRAEVYATEARGYQWVRGALPLPPAATPSALPQPALVTQEQPYHPQPFVYAGHVPQASVAPAVCNVVVTAQEQPGHPYPMARPPSLPGPLQAAQIGNKAGTVQEQPYHPAPFVCAGVPPQPGIPPVAKIVITKQEPPWHPAPYEWSSPPLTGIPPITSGVFTRQESPYHPAPGGFVLAGPVPQIGIAPVTNAALTRQEQPYHPLPAAYPSVFVLNPNVTLNPGAGAIVFTGYPPVIDLGATGGSGDEIKIDRRRRKKLTRKEKIAAARAAASGVAHDPKPPPMPALSVPAGPAPTMGLSVQGETDKRENLARFARAAQQTIIPPVIRPDDKKPAEFVSAPPEADKKPDEFVSASDPAIAAAKARRRAERAAQIHAERLERERHRKRRELAERIAAERRKREEEDEEEAAYLLGHIL